MNAPPPGAGSALRRLFDAVGLAVSRVIRIRYGPIKLGELRRGDHRPLSRPEIEALYRAVRLPQHDKAT